MMRLIGLALLFIHSLAYAETEIEQLEILSHRISSSFSALVFFDGQEKYLNQVNDFLDQGDRLLNQIQLDGNQPSQQQSPQHQSPQTQLKQQWQKARELVDSNSQSVADNLDIFEYEWSLINQVIQKQITEIQQQHYKNKNPLYSSPSVLLQVELETILSLYMQHSTEIASGFSTLPSQNSIETSVATVDTVLASDFSDNQRLQKKWRFIRRTLLDHNAESVPFIVLKIFDDMRTIIRSG